MQQTSLQQINQIRNTTSQTIKNLTNILKHNNNITTFHTGIYYLPCKDCDKHYISKTQHNLQKESINTNDQLN